MPSINNCNKSQRQRSMQKLVKHYIHLIYLIISIWKFVIFSLLVKFELNKFMNAGAMAQWLKGSCH
jgi:amino acid permease